MSTTSTPKLGLTKAVVGTREPFSPTAFNANLDKIDQGFADMLDCYLPTDVSFTNLTPQSDPSMILAVRATSVYAVEGWLMVNSLNSVDVKVLTALTGSTFYHTLDALDSAATGSTGARESVALPTHNADARGTTGADSSMRLTGTLFVTTAGNFEVRFAPNSAGTLVVKKGSRISLRRIG